MATAKYIKLVSGIQTEAATTDDISIGTAALNVSAGNTALNIVSGNAVIGGTGTLSVGGTSTLAAVNASGAVAMNGGGSVGSGQTLTMQGATLAAGSGLTISGAVNPSGAWSFSNTVGLTYAGTALTLGASSNASFGGTVSITGAGTALSVTNNATISGVLTLNKASGTALSVTADATIGGTLGVTSSATVGSLNTATIDNNGGALSIGANTTSQTIGKASTTATFPGSVQINGNLTVQGAETIVGGTTFSSDNIFGPSGTATVGTTTFDSVKGQFQYSWWNGGSAQTANAYAIRVHPSSAAAGTGDLQFLDAGTTERLRVSATTGLLSISAKIDVLAAGALTIGDTTATSIVLGKAATGTSVAGLLTASNGLTSTAGTTALGTTNVSGVVTLSFAGTALSLGATSNATFGGTVGITGTLTAGTINASGVLTLSYAGTALSLGASSNASFAGTITASNTVSLTYAGTALSLGASSNATFGGTVGITGTATLGTVNASGVMTLSYAGTALSLGATSNATFGGTVSLTKASGTALSVTADATIGGTLGVTSAATVGSLNAGSGLVQTTGTVQAGTASASTAAATPDLEASGYGNIGASAAAVLSIGTDATRTGAINIGRSGQTTTIKGNLTVDGALGGSIAAAASTVVPGFNADTGGVTQYHALKISGADVVAAALATSVANATLIGFADSTKSAGQAVGIYMDGIITPVKEGAQTWTAGQPIFLSASVVGTLTNVAPSGSGQVVLRVGYAKSNTQLVILIGTPTVLA